MIDTAVGIGPALGYPIRSGPLRARGHRRARGRNRDRHRPAAMDRARLGAHRVPSRRILDRLLRHELRSEPPRLTRAPEKAPNAKRGPRARTCLSSCAGAVAALRSTKAGLPRTHECGLPATTNARYVAQLWGITDEESGEPAWQLWQGRYFEAWRAKAWATTRMREAAGTPVRWVKVVEVGGVC